MYTYHMCLLFNVSYTNTGMLLLVHSIRAYQTEENWKVFVTCIKRIGFCSLASDLTFDEAMPYLNKGDFSVGFQSF